MIYENFNVFPAEANRGRMDYSLNGFELVNHEGVFLIYSYREEVLCE